MTFNIKKTKNKFINKSAQNDDNRIQNLKSQENESYNKNTLTNFTSLKALSKTIIV